jgi:hypothetical protein
MTTFGESGMQTIDIMLAWQQQDAALDYAKDLEKREWSVKVRPSLEALNNWRWHLEATKPERHAAPSVTDLLAEEKR